MNKVNELLDFSHPFESGYSIVRRLAIANGVARLYRTLKDLNRCKNHFNSHLEPSFTGCKTTLYKFVGDYPEGPIDTIPTELTGKLSVKKQCPECARMLFHSHLYDVDWLKFCPIHKCELLTRCPDCGNEWTVNWSLDRLRSERQKPCRTCGLTDFPEQFEFRQANKSHITIKLAPYQMLLKDFHIRNRFSMATQTHRDDDRLVGCIRENLEASDIEVPKLMSHLNAVHNLERMTLVKCPEKFCTPIPVARLTQTEPALRKTIKPSLNPSDVWRLWLDVLKFIVANVRLQCGPDHVLHYPGLHSKEFGPCPYCFALGEWIRTSHSDYLCEPYRFGRFHPNIVVTTAIDCEKREFNVPESLQREILHTDFLHYFVRLLRANIFENSAVDKVDYKPGKQFFVDQCPGEDAATVWRITSPLVEWEEISDLCQLSSTLCEPYPNHPTHLADVVYEGKPLGFKSFYLYGGAIELSQLMSLRPTC